MPLGPTRFLDSSKDKINTGESELQVRIELAAFRLRSERTTTMLRKQAEIRGKKLLFSFFLFFFVSFH
jgi:hypothetical protein